MPVLSSVTPARHADIRLATLDLADHSRRLGDVALSTVVRQVVNPYRDAARANATACSRVHSKQASDSTSAALRTVTL